MADTDTPGNLRNAIDTAVRIRALCQTALRDTGYVNEWQSLGSGFIRVHEPHRALSLPLCLCARVIALRMNFGSANFP